MSGQRRESAWTTRWVPFRPVRRELCILAAGRLAAGWAS